MTTSKLIEQFKKSKYFLCSNLDRLSLKLETLNKAGLSSCHVIADFDMTLTKFYVNGKRNHSSHGLFARSAYIPQQFKEDERKLYDKFYPIEISADVDLVTKTKAMQDWGNEAHALITKLKIKREDIKEMVKECPTVMREGLDKLFSVNIPILVFSAGIADVIEEILEYEGLKSENVHVVSNRMIFDDKSGVIVGFEDPVIHVLNKNEFTSIIQEEEHSSKNHSIGYKNLLKKRSNVILIGDSIGDIKMAQGVKHETCLSIGLLNRLKPVETVTSNYLNWHELEWEPVDKNEKITKEQCKALVKEYIDTFDIVFWGDNNLKECGIVDVLNSLQ